MLRTCDRPGCETLTLGSFCIAHEPEIAQLEFVRGRPHPPALTAIPLQLRLPKKISA
jgi:hypothetical protein